MAVDGFDIQRSPEWHLARLGKATASRMADVLSRTKSGYGASRNNYMAELVAERLTGVPAEQYTSAAMQWGTNCEPMARAAYAFHADIDVEEVGFVAHPTIAMSGASPDGFVGEDGLVEIKCPAISTHIETLRGGRVADKYYVQIQWQLACTGRAWCDFVSYDPRMPISMQLFVQRVPRDNARIRKIEKEVIDFLAELDAIVIDLKLRYGTPAMRPPSTLMETLQKSVERLENR
jgi:putative phage-type endonuclease